MKLAEQKKIIVLDALELIRFNLNEQTKGFEEKIRILGIIDNLRARILRVKIMWNTLPLNSQSHGKNNVKKLFSECFELMNLINKRVRSNSVKLINCKLALEKTLDDLLVLKPKAKSLLEPYNFSKMLTMDCEPGKEIEFLMELNLLTDNEKLVFRSEIVSAKGIANSLGKTERSVVCIMRNIVLKKEAIKLKDPMQIIKVFYPRHHKGLRDLQIASLDEAFQYNDSYYTESSYSYVFELLNFIRGYQEILEITERSL